MYGKMCKTGLQQITAEEEEGTEEEKEGIDIHPHEVHSSFSAMVASTTVAIGSTAGNYVMTKKH